MGDRAIVVCKQGNYYSPGCYVHWHGSLIKEWLQEAGPGMRAGDADYAIARFVVFCGNKISGPLSLGLSAPPHQDGEDYINWGDYSPGDAGVFVVDVTTGLVTNPERPDDENSTFTIELAHV